MDVEERRRRIRAWLAARTAVVDAQSIARDAELRALDTRDIEGVELRRRRLPHWELAGSTYFVTFRVARGRGEPFRLRRIEARAAEDVGHASQPALPPFGLGSLVEEAILFGFEREYGLDAYVVMPDHVHLLLTPQLAATLGKLMQGIKGSAAHRVNEALGTRGPLWQDESFDHLIRGEPDRLDRLIYIHENRVAARLVARPADFPLSSLVTLDPPGRREALRRLLAEPGRAG